MHDVFSSGNQVQHEDQLQLVPDAVLSLPLMDMQGQGEKVFDVAEDDHLRFHLRFAFSFRSMFFFSNVVLVHVPSRRFLFSMFCLW